MKNMKIWVVILEVLLKHATRVLALMAHERMLYGAFVVVT